MTPEQIKEWALSKNWTLDPHGNLRKTHNDKSYRIKLGDKKVRYEIQQIHDLGEGRNDYRWMRLSSGFYKDLSISEDSKLIGLKRAL